MCKSFDACGLGCDCTETQTRCGPLCADLGSDPFNCGACGAICGLYQTCIAGACSPADAGVGLPLFAASIDALAPILVPAYEPFGGWLDIAPLQGDAGRSLVIVDESGTGAMGGEYAVFNPAPDGGYVAGALGTTPGPTNDSMVLGAFTGSTDMVVSNLATGTLWLLPGQSTSRGPGFGPPVSNGIALDGIEGSYQMVAVDVNQDGKLDLLVDATKSADWAANPGVLEVAVLLGDGAGGFEKPIYSSMGAGYFSSPYFLVDVNGDGKPDLISGSWVYLNIGAGHFAAGSMVQDGGLILGVGDFNEDGSPDVATLHDLVPDGGGCAFEQLDILYGSRSGAFTSGPTFNLPYDLAAVVVGDYDGDHHLDLALLFQAADVGTINFVRVYLGDGLGGFWPDPQQYPLDAEVGFSDARAMDLAGSGKDDLILWTSGAANGGSSYPSGVEIVPPL